MEIDPEPKPTIDWLRILLAIGGGYLASYMLFFCAISIFGSLAFRGQPAPAQSEIEAFAVHNSAWVGSMVLLLTTVAAAFWAARDVDASKAQLHGLIIGAGLGLVSLLSEVVFGGFDLLDLAISALAIGAGWIGALLGRQRS